jgi:hypothetical protein
VAGFQAESGNLVNPVADFDLEETEAALQYDVRAVIGGRQRRLVAVSSHQDVSSQEWILWEDSWFRCGVV